MRIAIVGVGGVGSAALRFLAQAGHTVVGFEQFQVGHERGSSHGASRILRYTYPDRLYTQLMGDAYPLWAELERAAGEELFVRCGGLFFGVAGDNHVRETEQALLACKLPYEKLGASAIHERFPALRLRDDEVALFQPESGFLRAARCVLANTRLAQSHGAELREETPVQSITQRGDQVIVHTEIGEALVFDRAIVTAGAWMGKLLARLRLPFVVTRQQTVYLAIAHNAHQFSPQQLPVWIDATSNWYGFATDGQTAGVKLACHDRGATVDPDAPERAPDDRDIERTVAYAARRLPDLAPPSTHAQACLYTNTPDEDFIVDRLPDTPHVWLVSGCSGHGFKFTVLLGKIAAELALGNPCRHDLGRFSLRRFTQT